MQSYFHTKKVLLTGGAGFIGSHLADQLIKDGADLTIVDNLLTGSIQNIEHLQTKIITADISQPAESYLPNGYQPDLVLHFASPASPVKYRLYPIQTYQANSFGTHYLLQYLLKHAPSARFIFASTSEVYGDPLVHPQVESYWGNVNPNGPRSYYDEAKRLGETICGVHQSLGIDTRIVRIFNTYGPRIDVNDGRVIPNLLNQVLMNQPLTVYGDGSQTRSYCYVSDLVEGILLLAATEGLSGETVNLGNPEEQTVLATAQLIQALFTQGQTVPIEFKPLPADDPHRRRPDIGRAQQLLNWQPRISLHEGLLRTAEYFRRRNEPTAKNE